MIKGEYYFKLTNGDELYTEDNEYFFWEAEYGSIGIVQSYSSACEYLSKHQEGGVHVVEGLTGTKTSKRFVPFRNILSIEKRSMP